MTKGDADHVEDHEKDDPMQHLIGQQLKAMYSEVLAEPIPPRLLHLLEKLDEVTSDKSGKGS